MKMNYIKPVCEANTVLSVVPLCSSVTASGDAQIGWGGKDDGSNDPGVKADNFWGDEEW